MSTATLEHVDPKTLMIGTNVRLDSRLDKQFVNSIRDRGVLVPIVAYRDGERLIVVCGQRRTLAAVEAGRDTVPVMVTETPQEADRLTDQLAENDHRAEVTSAERVAAYEQLSALGLTAGQIAKRTARDRAEVDAALTVAKSKLASSATQRWDFLTIDQAAVLAEFEGDGDAVKELVVAAQKGGFTHRAQQLRDQRTELAAKAQAARALTEAGVTVIEQPKWDNKEVKGLSQLTHDAVPLTADSHARCPGHAAYLANQWIYPEGDDDSDWDDRDESDEPGADEGEAAQPYRGWVAAYVCTDYRNHGHINIHASSRPEKKTAAQMSETEREIARDARRDVIQSNKDWISAETVRRTWLISFLARKTSPKPAVHFVAGSLASGDYAVSDAISDGNKLAMELLGLWAQGTAKARYKRDASDELAAQLAKATDARAQVITLGMLLAAYEAKTGKHSWRNTDQPTARYLLFLEANGYELSKVELRACGHQSNAAPDDHDGNQLMQAVEAESADAS
ncbi:MAG TPA: hypothetical protein DGG94_05195 [Micromonosporaceae bacterium]|nr:hypothetical protein [Micromonosporaceae bacterium]HCU49195.1 hypothetical protein [Micromonosporaceae bacterium]